jgi:hypothetical protein
MLPSMIQPFSRGSDATLKNIPSGLITTSSTSLTLDELMATPSEAHLPAKQ